MFTLHNGDCLQVMPTIPSGSIDAIITDLPYGTTACKWDTVIEFAPMWKEAKRVLKPNGAFITTASQPFTSALIMSNPHWFKCNWYWNKGKGGNFATAKYQPLRVIEDVVVFCEGKSTYNPQMELAMPENIRPRDKAYKQRDGDTTHGIASKIFAVSKNHNENMRYPKNLLEIKSTEKECNNVNRIHRTQKPVALYEYLIKTYTNEGETVLDIAMGSGTTIEAAERTGRNSIGIEKDEGIFQSAVLRLAPFTPSNTACTGRLDSSATQSSFTAEGIRPAKARGAKRRQ